MKQERFAFARLKSDLILPVLYAMRYFLTLMSFSAPFYPVIYYIIFEHPSSLNIRARTPTHEGITKGGARESRTALVSPNTYQFGHPLAS